MAVLFEVFLRSPSDPGPILERINVLLTDIGRRSFLSSAA